MSDIKTGDEIFDQMEFGGFRLTEAQKEELRRNITGLLLSFDADKNLIDQFLKSPFSYLQQNYPISFLEDMMSKKPDLVYSFDRAIRRLKIELMEARGNCLACILSALALIYAFLLHFGLSVELLKSVIAEVVLALADYFRVDDKARGFLELIAGLATTIAPLSLARRFCRMMGLCQKVSTSMDVDTIGSSLAEKVSSERASSGAESLKRGGNFDL
ncbi:hypothetical protein [Algoriphagus sp. A40]|uniref:hypothetical protein n=1 Tax=Algoriphagus sp. A40 TaxID=1945863 RepID=UPI00098643A8|nr:hypothetical protein [Algoriphagus sp. A40]OOG77666.1 hypothetical protein B0E43_04530 [Algoriphagus sp. A40]